MRWFRDNIRQGSWAALIALAINLALSFGHVHAIDGKGQGRHFDVLGTAGWHACCGHAGRHWRPNPGSRRAAAAAPCSSVVLLPCGSDSIA
jgi:hypothetical protein